MTSESGGGAGGRGLWRGLPPFPGTRLASDPGSWRGWTGLAVRARVAPGLPLAPGSRPRPQRRSGQCQRSQQGAWRRGRRERRRRIPGAPSPGAVAGRRLAAGQEAEPALPTFSRAPSRSRPGLARGPPGPRRPGRSMCARPRATAPARLRAPSPPAGASARAPLPGWGGLAERSFSPPPRLPARPARPSLSYPLVLTGPLLHTEAEG